MPENLNEYRTRTGFMWDSLPPSGGFQTSASLPLKVSHEGSFCPFYGDTVIFDLPLPMLLWLREVQQALYLRCGDCLAQPLPADSFHITLHDLSNAPGGMPEQTAANQEAVRPVLAEAVRHYPQGIRVRSCCTFSMVSTSIVMGFEPAEEADCHALMTLYEHLQQVVPLSYPLTLHATLAYYRPGTYPEETLQRLRSALAAIGRDRTEWTLPVGGLRYARFDSMVHYGG